MTTNCGRDVPQREGLWMSDETSLEWLGESRNLYRKYTFFEP